MAPETILIVSPGCPACKKLLEQLDRFGIADKYRIVDASTKEGTKFAKKLGITDLPECVVVEKVKKGFRVTDCTDEEWPKTEGKDVEILRIDEKCHLEFDKQGNIKVGDCKGRVLNPVELHLLDRVNDALGNT